MARSLRPECSPQLPVRDLPTGVGRAGRGVAGDSGDALVRVAWCAAFDCHGPRWCTSGERLTCERSVASGRGFERAFRAKHRKLPACLQIPPCLA